MLYIAIRLEIGAEAKQIVARSTARAVPRLSSRGVDGGGGGEQAEEAERSCPEAKHVPQATCPKRGWHGLQATGAVHKCLLAGYVRGGEGSWIPPVRIVFGNPELLESITSIAITITIAMTMTMTIRAVQSKDEPKACHTWHGIAFPAGPDLPRAANRGTA